MSMISKSTGSVTPPTILTSSEKDVLQMIAEGYRLEEIGSALALSQVEIDRLLEMAERKLGAQNRLHAVTIAVLNGHIAIGPE